MLHPAVGSEHLLVGVLRVEGCLAMRVLMQHGFDVYSLREEVLSLARERDAAQQKKELPFLTEYSRDLTALAASGGFDPLVGREREVERIVQILSRRTKNNPILLGEPGVGKTAIVEGLAQRIVEGRVPIFLATKKVLALDLSLIVAGTKYRGQFEERLKGILKELRENKEVIVFVDEIHSLIGAGSAEGSLDAANILKPALSRGEIACIGATTLKEYRKFIEKDRSLLRRFQAVVVNPPLERGDDEHPRGDQGPLRDLPQGALRRRSAAHRDLPVDALHPGPLPARQGDRRPRRGRRQGQAAQGARHPAPAPHRAGDPRRRQADEAGDLRQGVRERGLPARARDRAARGPREDVGRRAARKPSSRSRRGTSRRSSPPGPAFRSRRCRRTRPTGCCAWRTRCASTSSARTRRSAPSRAPSGARGSASPIRAARWARSSSSGPSGVGKTEVARRLAEFLFGSQQALVRFDMSEYMEKHAVSKMIGSPPGYVGHEEGGQLTERIRRQPYSVVLFDEIEKAHPDLANLLLQILEDGMLTDAYGNQVDFRNTLVLMTSNLGSKLVLRGGRMGFGGQSEEESFRRIEEEILSELKRSFQPGVHQPGRRGHRLPPARRARARGDRRHPARRGQRDARAAAPARRSVARREALAARSRRPRPLDRRPSAPADDPAPRPGRDLRSADSHGRGGDRGFRGRSQRR